MEIQLTEVQRNHLTGKTVKANQAQQKAQEAQREFDEAVILILDANGIPITGQRVEFKDGKLIINDEANTDI